MAEGTSKVSSATVSFHPGRKMNYSLLGSFISFSIATGFTPGPNNLIALATGANFGYRKTLPHVFGVALGFNVMYFLMGAGLGSLFKRFPLVQDILLWTSLVYLVFLAWKIAKSTSIGSSSSEIKKAKPISFFGSVAFQWINPKAWFATLTLVSAFTDPDAYWFSLAMGGFVNLGIAFSSVSVWAVFGTLLKNWLEHPVRLRVFNWSMAALLLLSVVPSVLRTH